MWRIGFCEGLKRRAETQLRRNRSLRVLRSIILRELSNWHHRGRKEVGKLDSFQSRLQAEGGVEEVLILP